MDLGARGFGVRAEGSGGTDLLSASQKLFQETV